MLYEFCCRIVSEIFFQSQRNLIIVCSAAAVDGDIVFHVKRYSAVVHQLCHRGIFCFGAACSVSRCHVGPVVSGLAEVCAQGSVVPLVGVAASAFFRPFVVAHNLRHGCCHTAGNTMFAILRWAQVIIGCSLIPRNVAQQRCHCRGVFVGGSCGVGGAVLAGGIPLHILGVALHHKIQSE